jgi:phage terminase large subunit-like protein
MLEGAIPMVEHYFGIIYTLDEGDDWKDPDVWVKSNPNLGVSVQKKYMEEQCKMAESSTLKITNFKTKNLNIWCKTTLGWISAENWAKCGKPKYTEDSLKGRKCYGGMDLSSTQDLSAVVFSFPPEAAGEKYKHIYRFYMPEELVQEHEDMDKVPYQAWIDQGLICATPGNVIDYDFIEQDIMEAAELYDIQEFAFDPFNATEISNHITDAGITTVAIRQSYSGMSALCKTFEQKVLSKQMTHNNNPVMKWMISCVELKTDRQGNVMLMKPKRGSTGKRIDGVVANVMALGRASLLLENTISVYDDNEVLMV